MVAMDGNGTKQISTTRPVWDHKTAGCSRISNSDHSKRMIIGDAIVGRRKIARRFRDLAFAIAADQGGADQLSGGAPATALRGMRLLGRGA
jgi:hypothetical protein